MLHPATESLRYKKKDDQTHSRLAPVSPRPLLAMDADLLW